MEGKIWREGRRREGGGKEEGRRRGGGREGGRKKEGRRREGGGKEERRRREGGKEEGRKREGGGEGEKSGMAEELRMIQLVITMKINNYIFYLPVHSSVTTASQGTPHPQ